MASSSSSNAEAKSEKIVMQALQRIAETVLLSRVPSVPSSSKAGPQMLLDTPSVDFVTQILTQHWTGDLNIPLQIDVHCRKNGQAPILLERWLVHYKASRPEAEHAASPDVMTRKAYKQVVVMLRTLFSFCRVLPAYQLFKQACSDGFQGGLDLHCDLYGQRTAGRWDLVGCSAPRQDQTTPLDFEGAPTEGHDLAKIPTPFGSLAISSTWQKEDPTTKTEEVQQPMMGQVEIRENYVPSGLGSLLQRDTTRASGVAGSMGAAAARGGRGGFAPGMAGGHVDAALGGGMGGADPMHMMGGHPGYHGYPGYGTSMPSQPIAIPWNQQRRRSTSSPGDHFYSRSEGSSNRWRYPGDTRDARASDEAYISKSHMDHAAPVPHMPPRSDQMHTTPPTPPMSTPPFLHAEPGSHLVNQLEPPAVNCSPPFSLAAPESLLASSPMEQHHLSALSARKSGLSAALQGSPRDAGLIPEEDGLQSLPESPFLRVSPGQDKPAPTRHQGFDQDLDVLPATAHSILANLHGSSLRDQTALVSERESLDKEDILPFALSARPSLDAGSSPGSHTPGLDPRLQNPADAHLMESEVSSFMPLSQTPPDLQLFASLNALNINGQSPGKFGHLSRLSEARATTLSQTEDALQECRNFSESLR